MAPHWNHNTHYHDLLLRHLPVGAVRALDVGCGTGRLTRRLALRVDRVDALDPSPVMVAAARERTPDRLNARFTEATLADHPLEPGAYDFVTALSSLHHMPLGPSLARLRSALAPGGVLAVCGLYRREDPADLLWDAAALVPQWTVGASLALGRAMTGVPDPDDEGAPMPMLAPSTSLAEIRRAAAEHLPGARTRRLLFWRYLLTWRAPGAVYPA
ncbi:class I SAM-dependent methyltransferase [Actinorugispora endophytica]|uniref:Methyltransferase family protein n=1 Tax=Actinorugispora endophytica TaxID=1605990 RepID=A0A4R6V775_9ACTN|nr:class I SAM-dependent methyltransferase [Actinorugispora endophytica]TDQ54956.1 methyltransferase family protein [Actinorugispora endophytica]